MALILGHFDPGYIVDNLDIFSEEQRNEICYHLAAQSKIDKELLDEMMKLLFMIREMLEGRDLFPFSSVRVLGNILSKSDSEIKNKVLESIEKRDSKLAEKVRDNILNFKHFLNLDDRSMQRVLCEVDVTVSILIWGMSDYLTPVVKDHWYGRKTQGFTVFRDPGQKPRLLSALGF